MVRLAWCTQLLICQHELLDFDPSAPEYVHLGLTTMPDYFNKDKLPFYSRRQLAYHDECHKQCDIGRIGSVQVLFSRNEDGVFDKNGKYAPVGRPLHVKYAKEG